MFVEGQTIVNKLSFLNCIFAKQSLMVQLVAKMSSSLRHIFVIIKVNAPLLPWLFRKKEKEKKRKVYAFQRS